ncbi:glycosyltransferase family 4 protein, partial [Acidithiobacillus caldus]|uniref:hypothetical protein n=1 Tax=Acidithiobacillus caldus TaxID=33059 RepID=UPI001C07420C
MLIDAAKKCLQVLLTSRNVIAVSRALLRPFPAIDEEVREQVYRLRKKLISCNKATIISHESDQDIAERDRQPHQFLVDISELVLRDVHTGVQRVVRSVALELLRRPPANYTVEIVYADRAGRLRYARNFANRLTGSSKDNVEDTIVSVRPGDLFFCADLHLTYPFSSLLELKRKGLRIIFTIHDIIALKNPEFFPKALVLGFSDWFNGVMAVADAIVCVSQAAADDVMVWLSNHTDIRTR